MRSSIKGRAGWRAGGCTLQRTLPCMPMNVALLAVWLAAGGCSRGDGTPAALEWRAHVDTVGDTITVHTLARDALPPSPPYRRVLTAGKVVPIVVALLVALVIVVTLACAGPACD